ncbi:MAG TPA: DUF3703 domain-containing protein [Spirillospora sp.]|nr:DUF3703 domain-containing protein [Spirillospora sp.]
MSRRWRAAERAHILSQPWPLAHTRTHVVMPRLAVRDRDLVEALGQLGSVHAARLGLEARFKSSPAGGRENAPWTTLACVQDGVGDRMRALRVWWAMSASRTAARMREAPIVP